MTSSEIDFCKMKRKMDKCTLSRNAHFLLSDEEKKSNLIQWHSQLRIGVTKRYRQIVYQSYEFLLARPTFTVSPINLIIISNIEQFLHHAMTYAYYIDLAYKPKFVAPTTKIKH